MATTFECPCCDKTVRNQRAVTHLFTHSDDTFSGTSNRFASANIARVKSALKNKTPYALISLSNKSRDIDLYYCFGCDTACKDLKWMKKHNVAHSDHVEGHLCKCEELVKKYVTIVEDDNEPTNDKYEKLLAEKDDEISRLKKELELMKKQSESGKPCAAPKRLDTTAERLNAKSDAIDKFCEVIDIYNGNSCYSDYYSYVSQQAFRYYVKQEMSEDSYDALMTEISDVSYFKTYLPGGENAPDGLN